MNETESPKDYRETVIRLDHDSKTAEIWTENRGIITRAKRCGWTQKKAWGRGLWLEAPLRAVLIRKAARPARSGAPRGGFKPKAGTP